MVLYEWVNIGDLKNSKYPYYWGLLYINHGVDVDIVILTHLLWSNGLQVVNQSVYDTSVVYLVHICLIESFFCPVVFKHI